MFLKGSWFPVRWAGAALLGAAMLAPSLASPAKGQVCPAQGCDFCLDCNSDGSVTLGEVQQLFLIFLGQLDSAACPVVDGLETEVTLGDTQKGFDQFLIGCLEESERIEQSISGYGVIGFGSLHAQRGLPPAESGGPTLTVPAEATVPAGATVGPVPLMSDQPFTTVILAVPGADGFYRADLPEPMTEVAVQITFGDAPPRPSFDCLFSAGSAGGSVGPAGVTTITIE